MIHYQVELADPHAHAFRVSLKVDQPSAAQIFALPVWIPGSYLVREFAKNIVRISAAQNDVVVPMQQLDKTSWQVLCQTNASLVLTYEVYAWDASVRTAYLDATRAFFNGTSMFMRVVGQEQSEHQVSITPFALSLSKGEPWTSTSSVRTDSGFANNWRIATSMQTAQIDTNGWGTYTSPNYDDLIEHPFEIGELQDASFTVRGIPHRLVVSGAAASFDMERLLRDTQSIVQAELDFWHPDPHESLQNKQLSFDRYVFMLRVVHDGYGGLEHTHSTALIAKRSDLPQKSVHTEPVEVHSGYTQLLGLISHEYFHTWNVKRLRPSTLVPYDYQRENYTELLWFFEGFTSYYDDLILRRASLVDDKTYLGLLSKAVNHVQQSPGRLVHPLKDASFEAWTKYYRMDENTPNATVSYYTKGALVALCLDLKLRQAGTNLDAVMRHLWRSHCTKSNDWMGGITESDIHAAIKAACLQAAPDKPSEASMLASQIQSDLRAWTHTTVELPLTELLSGVGVKLESDASKSKMADRLGLRMKGDTLNVATVLSNTPAQIAGVSAGDELLAVTVNQSTWRLTSLEDIGLYTSSDKALTLWVARDKQVFKLDLMLPAVPAVQTVQLKVENEEKLREWL